MVRRSVTRPAEALSFYRASPARLRSWQRTLLRFGSIAPAWRQTGALGIYGCWPGILGMQITRAPSNRHCCASRSATSKGPGNISSFSIPDQRAGTKTVKLAARSDADVPVYYYVREGPAEVNGGALKFTAIPRRPKFPITITLVAWQWCRTIEPTTQPYDPAQPAPPPFVTCTLR